MSLRFVDKNCRIFIGKNSLAHENKSRAFAIRHLMYTKLPAISIFVYFQFGFFVPVKF